MKDTFRNIRHNKKIIGAVHISEYDNILHIQDIYVVKSGTGLGTKTIKALINKAKKENKLLVLTSDAMRGKNNQKLNRELYTKLGFIKNSGQNKNKLTKEEFYISFLK